MSTISLHYGFVQKIKLYDMLCYDNNNDVCIYNGCDYLMLRLYDVWLYVITVYKLYNDMLRYLNDVHDFVYNF